MEHTDIVGKKLTFAYETETYDIDVVSEDKVRWTKTRGENAGRSDSEAYIYSQLTADIGLITWIEADGLGLSNVLDFSTGTVTTHANMGREVFENAGRLHVTG